MKCYFQNHFLWELEIWHEPGREIKTLKQPKPQTLEEADHLRRPRLRHGEKRHFLKPQLLVPGGRQGVDLLFADEQAPAGDHGLRMDGGAAALGARGAIADRDDRGSGPDRPRRGDRDGADPPQFSGRAPGFSRFS